MTQPDSGVKQPPVLLLHGTLFISGASVMVLEIAGTRVLGPLFGVGVQIWASLISVTLAALAVGYWIGGMLADRWPSAGLFHFLVLLAGAATLFVQGLAGPVMEMCAELGLKGGALAAALVLFGPGLLLLASLTPFACRIHPRHASRTGRTVGSLYAVSTIGSVLGALLVGFVLVPLLPTSRTLLVTAVLLGATGALGLLAWRRKAGVVAAAVFLVLALLPSYHPAPARQGVRLVRDEQSFYNRIQTVDAEGERFLLLDGLVHTHLSLEGPSGTVRCEYVRTVELVPAVRPRAQRFLLIGCGGGSMLRLLEGRGRSFDVVDVDEKVIQAAREDFGAAVEGATFHVDDGRRFLKRGGPWDAVLLDVVSTEVMPEHLSNADFLREVKDRLAPDGVVFMNSIGEPGGHALASFGKTLRTVFDHVLAFVAHARDESTNVLWLASATPLTLPPDLLASYEDRVYEEGQEGTLLTDDYNPINAWNAPLGFRMRGELHARFGRAVFEAR
jgi:spermidine synthase